MLSDGLSILQSRWRAMAAVASIGAVAMAIVFALLVLLAGGRAPHMPADKPAGAGELVDGSATSPPGGAGSSGAPHAAAAAGPQRQLVADVTPVDPAATASATGAQASAAPDAMSTADTTTSDAAPVPDASAAAPASTTAPADATATATATAPANATATATPAAAPDPNAAATSTPAAGTTAGDPAASTMSPDGTSTTPAEPHIGPVTRFLSHGLRSLLLLWLLVGPVAAFTAAAVVRAADVDETIGEHLRAAAACMPFLIPQLLVSYAPLFFVSMLVGLFFKISMLLGIIVCVLVAVPVSVVCTVVGGLSLVRVALGERERTPRNAVEVVRANTSTVAGVAAVVLFASWAVALPAAIPLLPLQLVVWPVLGLVQLWGISCFVAMNSHLPEPLSLSGRSLLQEERERIDGQRAEEAAAAAVAADGAPAEPQVYRKPAAAMSNYDPEVLAMLDAEAAAAAGQAPQQSAPAQGPVFDGVVQPGATWGEWLELPTGGTVLAQLAWSDGPPLQLAAALQDGTWLSVPPLDASQSTSFDAPAGFVWLHVAGQHSAPQSARVTTWLPAASNAA